LTLSGTYGQGNFRPVSDGGSGTDIQFQAAASKHAGVVRFTQALASFGIDSAAALSTPMTPHTRSTAPLLGASHAV
jgi:hypothetical protein